MINVKISCGNYDKFPSLLRQTPNGSGVWGGCKFLINCETETCDWWIVCHSSGLQKTECVKVDPKHLVYCSMEPQEHVLGVGNSFLSQFEKIIICDRSIRHKNISYKNIHTWWVGLNVFSLNGKHKIDSQYTLDYDKLKNITLIKKNKLISIVVSNKSILPGHRSRIKFINELKKSEISSLIDFFGIGYNEIPDKWDAIHNYRYTIVLENTVTNDYWSEKLADAYLGLTFPIYYGCPNINEYFPSNSYAYIDISKPKEAIDVIKNIIESNYDDKVDYLRISKELVLDKYNIFNILSEICNCKSIYSIDVTLKPYKNWKLKLKKIFHDLWSF
jgi:hypothetical protein